ncbi:MULTISPECIES: hypothetical protein [unclassified Myroides]|uniref:hypothetical protein n=1 Tax=unclassified Myroides TaxID=2642485 RepID=UPI003D2F802E
MRVILSIWCFLFLIIGNSFGQTIIQDCSTQQFVADVVVYDSQTNTIIGVSDAHGAIELSEDIVDVTLVHPTYGNIKTVRQEVICIDQSLNTIVIEMRFDAKEELLDILQKTYDQYRVDPYDKQLFSYTGTIYENNNQGELLIQEKGGFNKNSTFYDTSLFVSDRLADFYDTMEIVSFLPLIAKDKSYFFFNNKKHFNGLIKKVKAAKVNKINTDYFVYDATGVNYWQFEIDPMDKRVVRFVNSKVELLSSDGKRKSPIMQRLIEVRYNLVDNKLEQRLNLFELYKSSRSELSLAKYLTINSVGPQAVPFEKSYSYFEYHRLGMRGAKKVRDLVIDKQK